VRFEAEIAEFGPALAFDVPFDPKAELGKVRAPVRVTINGYTFRTTIARMGGRTVVGLNSEVREGTGVAAGDRVAVELVADDEPRTVEVPPDLAAGLDGETRGFLDSLSYTHRKEYVRWIEGAKRAETRRARVEKAVELLRAKVRTPG
jgi:Bacteriocin-protection, YdeI or OmpD-Associated/Domain of unknown function (DUF1905)